MHINEYSTKDFYLSTVLMSAGCQLKAVMKTERGFSKFIFSENTDKCIAIIKNHWNGKNKVASKVLIEKIKELKSRLYLNC